MSAQAVRITVAATVTFLGIIGAACILAHINAALVASRPISHEADGSCCGGGRR